MRAARMPGSVGLSSWERQHEAVGDCAVSSRTGVRVVIVWGIKKIVERVVRTVLVVLDGY